MKMMIVNLCQKNKQKCDIVYNPTDEQSLHSGTKNLSKITLSYGIE